MNEIDCAQLIKIHAAPVDEHGRTSGSTEVIGTQDRIVTSSPDGDKINTSYIERQNLTMRMGMRRFTRLTNGHSKKLTNHAAAIALHFMYVNFARPHKSLADPDPRTPRWLRGSPTTSGRARRSPRCSISRHARSGGPVLVVGYDPRMAELADAIILAVSAHRGHRYPTDAIGTDPFIFHPLRVMLRLSEPDEQIVAVLHDVVEDTSVTLADLRDLGLSERIIGAIDLLTHRQTEPYTSYIERIAGNTLARSVKLADLEDNLTQNHGFPGGEEIAVRHRAAREWLLSN